MQILSKKTLPLGGFAGLTEHRLVTDSKIFGMRKSPATFEGLGNFVYLADAKFNPNGETGMHPHKEIDVISVMVSGRVSHKGSLEHGSELQAGEVQVQRAGGEGFSHNEVNPDDQLNRMIQLWVLPEEAGKKAGFKHYTPTQEVTRIYGGTQAQSDTFDSKVHIDVIKLASGSRYELVGETLLYVTAGKAKVVENSVNELVTDGDLVRSENAVIEVSEDLNAIVISQAVSM